MGEKILVPLLCYNYGRFLSECLDSIIKQTYENWKVVVRDPQSTDETKQVMSQYVKKDSRITYIKEIYPLTIGVARNRTIKENPDFPIIAYHDVDDIMMPDRLERSVEVIRDSDLIYGNMRAFGLHHNVIGSFPYVNFKLLLNLNLIKAPTVCFRYEVWKAIGGFDESVRIVGASDWDFWIRVSKVGFKFKYLNQILTLYRTHSKSITSLKHYDIFNSSGREKLNRPYVRNKHTSKNMGIRSIILQLLIHTWHRLLRLGIRI